MPSGTRPAPPVDTVRVTIHGTNAGHQTVNVIWLQLTTDGTKVQNDLASVVDSLAAAWNTDMMANVNNSNTVYRLDAVWITAVGSELIYSKAVSYTGAGGGTTGDASACVIVKWLISAYYRGGHPRTYLGSPNPTQVTNGSDIASSLQTSLATAALAFRNTVNALTAGHILSVTLGTVSFQTAKAWRSPPIFRSYIGAAVNPKLGTQRRRIHS